jgi:hypothetical protein
LFGSPYFAILNYLVPSTSIDFVAGLSWLPDVDDEYRYSNLDNGHPFVDYWTRPMD